MNSFVTGAHAGACTATDGSVVIGSFDASSIITESGDNVVGHSVSISLANTVEAKPTVCKCNAGQTSVSDVWDWTQYTLPTEVVDGRTYAIVNDYLEVAIEAGDATSKAYIPYSDHRHVASSNTVNVCVGAGNSGGGGYTALVRIRKAFVGFSDFGGQLIYQKGTNSAQGDADRVPEINYYINGSVTVPQSCELNAGQVIAIDFGSIGANLFSQAGAGNKPAGVNPQTRTVSIKCKNIDAGSTLSMRLETDGVSGNAVVSDNKDIGFIVADEGKTPLTPNNIDSNISFLLDDSATASVPITVWPVSVTGNKPAEGVFTAEGYLRVDFD